MNTTFWMITGTEAECLATVEDADDAHVLKTLIKSEADCSGHGRSKPVVAIELLPEFYTLLGRGVVKSMDEIQGRVFKSALHASHHIGMKGNGVATALATARRQTPPEYAAIVRGAIWRYLEDEGGS